MSLKSRFWPRLFGNRAEERHPVFEALEKDLDTEVSVEAKYMLDIETERLRNIQLIEFKVVSGLVVTNEERMYLEESAE
ncbi:MAG: hypothetical protein AAF348_17910 [Bacteroidota bacterium]